MKKSRTSEADAFFKKIDKGILEYRKAVAIDITKRILVAMWTVTIFPLIILWRFISGK